MKLFQFDPVNIRKPDDVWINHKEAAASSAVREATRAAAEKMLLEMLPPEDAVENSKPGSVEFVGPTTPEEGFDWAWVCDICKIKSLGEGPMNCWLCGRPMFRATLAEYKAAKGSWTHPARAEIVAGEEVYPLSYFWVCNACEATVISSVQPQCWPCREYMRNITYRELIEWRERLPLLRPRSSSQRR